MFAGDLLRDQLKTTALCLLRLLPSSPFARRYVLSFVRVSDMLPPLLIMRAEITDDVYVYPPPGWQLTMICKCHWRKPIMGSEWLIAPHQIDHYILNLRRVSS